LTLNENSARIELTQLNACAEEMSTMMMELDIPPYKVNVAEPEKQLVFNPQQPMNIPYGTGIVILNDDGSYGEPNPLLPLPGDPFAFNANKLPPIISDATSSSNNEEQSNENSIKH
jgi:hypothetical protein